MAELRSRYGLRARARPRIGGLLDRRAQRDGLSRTWMILFSGFFEPLFYLFFFVYPLGRPDRKRRVRRGDARVRGVRRPALLAASAMNGAFYDATNVFWKLRYGKVYDAMLSTPVSPGDVAVGETMWAVVRSMLYSAAFLNIILVLGLVESWWGVLILPACFVIGFGFAGAGIAAVTWMRELAGLRPDPARDVADVPLRDDVLPALRVPGGDRVDRAGCFRSTTASSSSARWRPERSAPSSSSTWRIS